MLRTRAPNSLLHTIAYRLIVLYVELFRFRRPEWVCVNLLIPRGVTVGFECFEPAVLCLLHYWTRKFFTQNLSFSKCRALQICLIRIASVSTYSYAVSFLSFY